MKKGFLKGLISKERRYEGMKKLALLSVMALLVGLLSAPQAFGFALIDPLTGGNYLGPVWWDVNDWSEGTQYTYNPGTNQYDPNPAVDFYGNANNSLFANTWGQANGSEDSWGILTVNQIYKPGDPSPVTGLLWESSLNEEITAIYYGVDDDNLAPIAGGSFDFYSVGGHVDFYLDTTPDFTASGGSPLRVMNTYPTAADPAPVGDATLFLSMDLVQGITLGNSDPTDDHITFFANLSSTTSPFTGSGESYANITGGSHQALFDSNGYNWTHDDNGNPFATPVVADFSLGWHVEAPSATPPGWDWLTDSFDPMKGVAVPEPGTMLLLGSGLLGLAGFGRKKLNKKNKKS